MEITLACSWMIKLTAYCRKTHFQLFTVQLLQTLHTVVRQGGARLIKFLLLLLKISIHQGIPLMMDLTLMTTQGDPPLTIQMGQDVFPPQGGVTQPLDFPLKNHLHLTQKSASPFLTALAHWRNFQILMHLMLSIGTSKHSVNTLSWLTFLFTQLISKSLYFCKLFLGLPRQFLSLFKTQITLLTGVEI